MYFATANVVMGPGEGRRFSLFFLFFLGAVIGCGLIIGGAALWERWRWALGLIFLADGLYSIAHVYGARSLAAKRAGAEAAHYLGQAKASALLGVTLLLLGGALVFYEKYRSK